MDPGEDEKKIAERKESISRQLTALRDSRGEYQQFRYQDLRNLVTIGRELCELLRSHHPEGAKASWTSLLDKANMDRKIPVDHQPFNDWWPTIISLVLKMDDLKFADN